MKWYIKVVDTNTPRNQCNSIIQELKQKCNLFKLMTTPWNQEVPTYWEGKDKIDVIMYSSILMLYI